MSKSQKKIKKSRKELESLSPEDTPPILENHLDETSMSKMDVLNSIKKSKNFTQYLLMKYRSLSNIETVLGVDRDTFRKFAIQHKLIIPVTKGKQKTWQPNFEMEQEQKSSSVSVVENSISLSPEEQSVLKHLNKKPYSVRELSRMLDRSDETISRILAQLKQKNYGIEYNESSHQMEISKALIKEFKPLDFSGFVRSKVKILLVGDTQFGSKKQQSTLFHTAYKVAEQEKVDFGIHVGDLTDGERVYRGHEQEVFLHGIDEFREYTIDVYPKTDKFKTYVIGGNHDWSFKRDYGYMMVQAICERRPDLVYRGETKAVYNIIGQNENFKICTYHPTGGTGFTSSYKPEKLNRALGRRTGVKFLAIGHYHIMVDLIYEDIPTIVVPCFQSQTNHLMQLGLVPVIGFEIIELYLDEKGNVVRWRPDRYIWTDRVIDNDFEYVSRDRVPNFNLDEKTSEVALLRKKGKVEDFPVNSSNEEDIV